MTEPAKKKHRRGKRGGRQARERVAKAKARDAAKVEAAILAAMAAKVAASHQSRPTLVMTVAPEAAKPLPLVSLRTRMRQLARRAG